MASALPPHLPMDGRPSESIVFDLEMYFDRITIVAVHLTCELHVSLLVLPSGSTRLLCPGPGAIGQTILAVIALLSALSIVSLYLYVLVSSVRLPSVGVELKRARGAVSDRPPARE